MSQGTNVCESFGRRSGRHGRVSNPNQSPVLFRDSQSMMAIQTRPPSTPHQRSLRSPPILPLNLPQSISFCRNGLFRREDTTEAAFGSSVYCDRRRGLEGNPVTDRMRIQLLF